MEDQNNMVPGQNEPNGDRNRNNRPNPFELLPTQQEQERRKQDLALNNPHILPSDILYISMFPVAQQESAMREVIESYRIQDELTRRIETLRRLTEQLNELTRRILAGMEA